MHCPAKGGGSSLIDLSWASIGALVLIIGLRTIDVSLDAVRISFSVQGRRKLSALVGFFEAVTFAIAAGLVFTSLTDNPVRLVAYGVGFAAGQFLGVSIVQWLSLGTVTVRFFMPWGPIGLVSKLRSEGYAVTSFDGEGLEGPVRLALVVVNRRDVPRVLSVARPWMSKCFVTVGDESPGSIFPHFTSGKR